MAKNICAMCSTPTPADHGLLCPRHRAEDDALLAKERQTLADQAARVRRFRNEG